MKAILIFTTLLILLRYGYTITTMVVIAGVYWWKGVVYLLTIIPKRNEPDYR